MSRAGIAALVVALSLASTGCVKVMTGRYAVRGHDVTKLVGDKGSHKPFEIGVARVDDIRRKLGPPLLRYENESTDIFDAVPRYKWIFYPWPVALMDQAGPGNPHVLVRLDYDAGGILQRYATTTTPGPVIHGAVPAWVHQQWPDLSERTPIAFSLD